MPDRVDVADLTEDELRAVVGLAGPRAVAAATGLPFAHLLTLAPTLEPPPDSHACPACGHPRGTVPRAAHERCGWCARQRGLQQVDRARGVLAAGVHGDDAITLLSEREGVSPSRAANLLVHARRRGVPTRPAGAHR